MNAIAASRSVLVGHKTLLALSPPLQSGNGQTCFLEIAKNPKKDILTEVLIAAAWTFSQAGMQTHSCPCPGQLGHGGGERGGATVAVAFFFNKT